MRVKILRAVRVMHQPGDIVEVSQADAIYLLTTHSAEPILDEPEAGAAEPEAEPAAKTGEEGSEKMTDSAEPVLDEPVAAEAKPAAKPVRKAAKK